jgi:hypothetical protein
VKPLDAFRGGASSHLQLFFCCLRLEAERSIK